MREEAALKQGARRGTQDCCWRASTAPRRRLRRRRRRRRRAGAASAAGAVVAADDVADARKHTIEIEEELPPV